MGRLTASKETLKPDPKYGSILASKFVNCLMWSGKKSVAENVFYGALDLIQEKIKDVEPIAVFTQALENVKPNIEVRSKRVGGASYQVPMQVSRNRQQSLAIRWILGGGPRKEGQAHQREACRRANGRVQSGRRGHDQTGERPSHGRGQQGLCPFRLVTSRWEQSHRNPNPGANKFLSTPRRLPPLPARRSFCAAGDQSRR